VFDPYIFDPYLQDDVSMDDPTPGRKRRQDGVFQWRYIPDISTQPDETLCTAHVVGTTDDGTDVLDLGGLEQIFVFNVNTTTEVTFDACLSSFDTILSIYRLDDTLFNSGTVPLVHRDDGGCEDVDALTRTKLTAVLSEGCYAFVVEGFSTEQGVFDISVTCADDVTPASINRSIACDQTVTGDSLGPIQPPLTAVAVIYSFTIANDNDPISFSACLSSFDVVLRIYDDTLTEQIMYRDDGGCDASNGSQALRPVLQTDEVGFRPLRCHACHTVPPLPCPR
jgi:hypothetical protein